MNLRRAAILLCILDVAIGCAALVSTWLGQPDPQTGFLNKAWAILLALPLLVTALPAAFMLARDGSQKRAFWFALSYPATIVLLFVAAAVLLFA